MTLAFGAQRKEIDDSNKLFKKVSIFKMSLKEKN